MLYAKYWLWLLFLPGCVTLEYTPWDEGLPKTGEWRTPLAVGDVNNDGFLDIAGIERKGNGNASVWLNLGNGNWQRATEGIHQKTECGVGADFGDVNNDGNLDVAFGRHCGGPAIYLGDGTGKWTNHSEGLLQETVNPIKLTDFDGDGLLDAITLGGFLEGFTVYKNTGKWEVVNTTLPDKITATSYQIITPDINNDGLPDIIATGGKIKVFENKGNFEFELKYESPEEFYTYLDYKEGILAAGTAQGLYVYENWEMKYNLTDDCAAGGVSLEDINNDGKTDLTASCKGSIKIYLGPNFTEAHSIQTTGMPHGLHVVDVNKDGKKDIIAAFDGGIYVWTH